MKMLSKNDYREIKGWMHRNARPLEMAVWNLLYENGSREAVIDALSFFQNEDGGFGSGLEPDCWNTESSPYTTLVAAGILRQTGAADEMGPDHPMLEGIFRYLESGVNKTEEGWRFSIPSNEHWPRAPWCSYSEEENRKQAMGISAGLCSFILSCGDRDSSLYQNALEEGERLLQKASVASDFGEMGVGGIFQLIGAFAGGGLACSVDLGALSVRMAQAANRAMERDPEKWSSYTPRPSEFIWSPICPLYKGNEEIVETELDYLIDTRERGGVWDITWSWFALGEQYPEAFALSKNWWKASKAIDKIGFLKSFGRIEE